MDATSDNPTTNNLGPGLTEQNVAAAVSKSGYPLQTNVSRILQPKFTLQEEWSYFDKDSKEIRTVDILASQLLYDPTTQEQPRVRPTLSLIIECKQSTLPYIFFLSPNTKWIPNFPLLAGLAKHEITLTTDDTPSIFTDPVLHVLGLDFHPFIADRSEHCMSFSKCVRKGSELELSGSEPFQALVLPLLKAMRHFREVESPVDTAFYFDCHAVVGVGVLDAPMIGVRVSETRNDLILLPWVRVVRHSTDETESYFDSTRLFAIDIVHKDFFQEYLDNNALAFAQDFSRLVIKHQHILATGEGFVPGLGKSHFRYEDRLQPRRIRAKVHRVTMIGENIFRFVTGRRPKGE